MDRIRLYAIASVIMLVSVIVYAAQDRYTAPDSSTYHSESTTKSLIKPESDSIDVEHSQSSPDQTLAIANSRKLDEIQSLLIKLEKRMTSLERDLSGIQADQNGSLESALPENITEPVNATMTVAGSVKNKFTQEQYFLALDQQISAEIIPNVSEEISMRFGDVFKSREDWREDVSIDASQCSSQFCKVVVSYPKSIDPASEFELDVSLYKPTVNDYPNSRSISTIRADGSKQITLYFSATGTDFPPIQP